MVSFDPPRGFGLVPALVLLAVLVGPVAPASAQCADLPGCVLVWSDEFDGTEVDLSKWTFQLGDGTEVGLPPGWGNNELQYYQAENATVAGGFLTITAKEESVAGRDYTSARMRSLGKGDWTFGRMEMRARMPIGQGLWPAFWMLPSDSIYGTWAASGEIDIVEYIGSQPDRILGTIHYGGPWPGNVFSATRLLPARRHVPRRLPRLRRGVGIRRDPLVRGRHAVRHPHQLVLHRRPVPGAVRRRLPPAAEPGRRRQPARARPTPRRCFRRSSSSTTCGSTSCRRAVVAITSPTADDVITPGDDLTITVSATDDGSIQLVQFLQDNAVLGEDTTPPYELTVPDVAAGCYSLKARARDDGGRLETSAPVADHGRRRLPAGALPDDARRRSGNGRSRGLRPRWPGRRLQRRRRQQQRRRLPARRRRRSREHDGHRFRLQRRLDGARRVARVHGGRHGRDLRRRGAGGLGGRRGHAPPRVRRSRPDRPRSPSPAPAAGRTGSPSAPRT